MSEDQDDRVRRIRERAYDLWEAAGKPEGQDEYFWHIAERDIEADDTTKAS